MAPADAMHVALASGMASGARTAMSSAWAHHRRGNLPWPSIAWMRSGPGSRTPSAGALRCAFAVFLLRVEAGLRLR